MASRIGTLAGAAYILNRLTKAFPPPAGRRHNLTVIDGGLAVTVAIGERWYTARLEKAGVRTDVVHIANTLIGDIRKGVVDGRQEQTADHA